MESNGTMSPGLNPPVAGQIRYSRERTRGARTQAANPQGQRAEERPLHPSLSAQWRQLSSKESVKKVLLIASFVSAAVYYAILGVLLFTR
jgi:hypothetical protein